jgi:hypothetical protein
MCPSSADSVCVGAPLLVDLRVLFTRLWLPFTDFVYIDSPLFIDLCGFFTRL